MMPQGQLGQSQQPPALFESGAPKVRTNVGLLGNESIQIPVKIVGADVLLTEYRRLLASVQPAFRLAMLKRQKFTPDGRQARVAASLAALNAPQPTDLPLAQWKQIVEEIEDED